MLGTSSALARVENLKFFNGYMVQRGPGAEKFSRTLNLRENFRWNQMRRRLGLAPDLQVVRPISHR
jgi:hypothetical protein